MKKLHCIVLSSLLIFFCNAQEPKKLFIHDDAIVLATWNIGHFSGGKVDHSTITNQNYKEKLSAFRAFVYDSIAPSILCINEYSREFFADSTGQAYMAEDVLLNDFTYKCIMQQNHFVCNAIFSNIQMDSTYFVPFVYNDVAILEMPRIAWHYFSVANIYISGEKVKMVCAHLVNRAEKHCQGQIRELIQNFRDEERVIICGDMNTWLWGQFRDAGYILANEGSLITFPSKSYALDNIFVKGLNISDVKVIKTELSDHYAISVRLTLKK